MTSDRRHLSLILTISLFSTTLGVIVPDFSKFLIERYGAQAERTIKRADLGPSGSFGGFQNPKQKLTKDPVILIHGINNDAGRFFEPIARYLYTKGYTWPEVYGSTWGAGPGRKSFLAIVMDCSSVKQTRLLIEAVHAYTGRKVDILAYSMGSPIARKAILGGRCVDSGEDLGRPLTALVDTFVGVAGANFGSSQCFLPLFGVCNAQNGLHCSSRFLQDINSHGRRKYEGSFVFSIYSTADDKVGHTACGKTLSHIPSADKEIVYRNGWNHDQVMDNTAEVQRKLVLSHTDA